MNRALVFCLGVTIGIMASYLVWHPVPSYATPRSAQLVPVPPAALTGVPQEADYGTRARLSTRVNMPTMATGSLARSEEVGLGDRLKNEAPLRAYSSGAPLSTGLAGYAVPSLGSSYLAMRLPRGTLVTITGPGGSWTARVNDYGPSSKIVPARIADIAVGHWAHVCGLPPSAGLCRVSVTLGAGAPVPTAPATDVDP